ncbi:MAG TPA: hypothetical protein PK478_02925, partial [Nitrospira sp.]|nr:hypothetical protein [Nitrospira sp.]
AEDCRRRGGAGRGGHGAGEDILPLLDIVEAFAAEEPMSGDTMRCIYCDADIPMTYSPHADGCPWLAARRLCGMEEV